MDLQYCDCVVFMWVCLGCFSVGMKIFYVCIGKEMKLVNVLIFMVSDCEIVVEVWFGDVIGIYNYGIIFIGDIFIEGEVVIFIGIFNFVLELFCCVCLCDLFKFKQLQKGLVQLFEEGVIQFFCLLISNDLILGVVGVLQFDVVVYCLKDEYGVEVIFELVSVIIVCWVYCSNEKKLEEFCEKNVLNLVLDVVGYLVYFVLIWVNLQLVQECLLDVCFFVICEVVYIVLVG